MCGVSEEQNGWLRKKGKCNVSWYVTKWIIKRLCKIVYKSAVYVCWDWKREAGDWVGLMPKHGYKIKWNTLHTKDSDFNPSGNDSEMPNISK